MPQASDINMDNISKNISILLKSAPGFGKTVAACSMAIDGPIWLAYWDKNSPIELKTYFKDRPEILANIEYNTYSSNNAHEFLNKLIDVSKMRPFPYYGIVVDSVTMMTSAAVNWSLGFRNTQTGAQKDPLNAMAVKVMPGWDEYKVETGLVTQALDLCRALPCNVIWTAHPISTLDLATGGADPDKVTRVSKIKKIVSYGSKVGEIIPGNFNEIYHMVLDKTWDSNLGRNIIKRIVSTESIGEDFAKTSLSLPAEFDITNKLFWEEWKKLLMP